MCFCGCCAGLEPNQKSASLVPSGSGSAAAASVVLKGSGGSGATAGSGGAASAKAEFNRAKVALKAVEVGLEQCDDLMFDLQLFVREWEEGKLRRWHYESLLWCFVHEIDEAIVCAMRVLTGSATADSIVTAKFIAYGRMPIPACRGGNGSSQQRTWFAPTDTVECLDSSLFGPNSSAVSLLRAINQSRSIRGYLSEFMKPIPSTITDKQHFIAPQNISKSLEAYRTELMDWRKRSELAVSRSSATDVLSHLSKLPARLDSMRAIMYWWPTILHQLHRNECIIC